MNVYKLIAPGEIKKEESEIKAPDEDELLIKVKNIGLCGSDLHLYRGTYSGPNAYPIMFGHEWSGVVEEVGSAVKGFKEGDKVTGDCSKFCGQCDNCSKDKNLCRHIEKFGITTDGASADYITRKAMYCYKADDDADLKLLALTEPVSVAMHLIKKVSRAAGDIQNKKILVYGGGAIGQAALLILKNKYHCPDVALSDLIPFRMELASKLGARKPDSCELTWNVDESYENMYNLTTFDIIIETTGVGSVFANALRLLRPMGILGCVGMISDVSIEQKLIVTKALTVIGSIGGTGEFEEVMKFIHDNEKEASLLISHNPDIENVDQGFAIAMDQQSAMKVIFNV